ncbi:methyl-accepting chemotaxis protein [Desulfurispira natronophila]|uniref:Methyl-accepting chemotaxis protein n=1 Tax=Desulfurispira natronophila TaxID=682562 RepID=A0A7W8DGJ4_9BACT|nr:methyl-accepting chemotaxis protein [Desulfurispira natronophila]MBB5021465.1 methyl-accepting chemotaxis protein [Desulfurispira natronophila]
MMVTSVAVVMVALAMIATHTTVEENYQQMVSQASHNTQSHIENLQSQAAGFAHVLSRNSQLAAATANGNTTELRRLLVREYREISKSNPAISTVEVTDSQGRVIMRGHSPEQHGDDKSSVPMVQQALGGDFSQGLTQSITTDKMSLDAVAPLVYNSQVVGTIKVGSYLRQNSARYLAQQGNTDVTFMVNNKVISTSLDNLRGSFSLPQDAQRHTQRGEQATDIVTIGDQGHNAAFFPLRDHNGDVAAVVINTLSRAELENTKLSAFWRTMGVVVVLTVVSLASTITIAYVITRPLEKMQQAFINLSQGDGDLTRRFPVYGKDEISKANEAINSFLDMTQHVVKEAMDGAHETATASEELSATAESLAANIGQQFKLVERTDALVNEVGENLDKTEELAVTSTEVLEDGYKMLTHLIDDFSDINSKIVKDSEAQQEMARKMQDLNTEAGRIESVLSIISDVADQTNLLALNASIEAARAGDQGRGFAVVADEVRVLAERTQSSLGEIRNIINSITASISDIHGEVDKVSQDILGISEGSQGLMKQAEDTQQKLMNTVDSSSELVRKSTFIAKKTKDLIETMREMFDLSQENKHAGENITDVSVTMSSKSNSQFTLLQRFKV